jgi:hypothetical protein
VTNLSDRHRRLLEEAASRGDDKDAVPLKADRNYIVRNRIQKVLDETEPSPEPGELSGVGAMLKMGVPDHGLVNPGWWPRSGGSARPPGYNTTLRYCFAPDRERRKLRRMMADRDHDLCTIYAYTGDNLTKPGIFGLGSRYSRKSLLADPRGAVRYFDELRGNGQEPFVVLMDNEHIAHNVRPWQETFGEIERALEVWIPEGIQHYLLGIELDKSFDVGTCPWIEPGGPPPWVYVSQMIGGDAPHEVSFRKSFGDAAKVWVHFAGAWGAGMGYRHIPHAHGVFHQVDWESHTWSRSEIVPHVRHLCRMAKADRWRIGIGEYCQHFEATEAEALAWGDAAAEAMRSEGVPVLLGEGALL